MEVCARRRNSGIVTLSTPLCTPRSRALMSPLRQKSRSSQSEICVTTFHTVLTRICYLRSSMEEEEEERGRRNERGRKGRKEQTKALFDTLIFNRAVVMFAFFLQPTSEVPTFPCTSNSSSYFFTCYPIYLCSSLAAPFSFYLVACVASDWLLVLAGFVNVCISLNVISCSPVDR